jgi:hypothetical protein
MQGRWSHFKLQGMDRDTRPEMRKSQPLTTQGFDLQVSAVFGSVSIQIDANLLQVSSSNLSPNFFVLEYTNQNTTMASSGGPEAEFDDPRRKELLQVLHDVLPDNTFSPTVWACLWLSDIDILKKMVAGAQFTPIVTNTALNAESTKIVPTCMIIQRILPC